MWQNMPTQKRRRVQQLDGSRTTLDELLECCLGIAFSAGLTQGGRIELICPLGNLGNNGLVIWEYAIDGSVQVQSGNRTHHDALVEGTPQLTLALLTGKMTLADAHLKGLRCEDDAKLLRRLGVK
jgi:hypothetical protein